MKNITSLKKYMSKNEKNILCFSVFILVIFNYLVLSIYVISQVPLFDDGTVHASIIREMRAQEKIIDYSPVGWVSSPLNERISIKPVVRHFPLFYVAATILTCFTDNVELSIVVINTFSIIFIIPIFFKLLKNIFCKYIAFYSSIFLLFAPMFLIVTCIRLMEGVLYFFGIIVIYEYFKYLKKSSVANLILLVLFITTLFCLKITSIFLILPVFIHFLIKNKLKKTLIAFIAVLLLSLPLFTFMLENNRTLLPVTLGFPIVDEYLNPQWNRDIADWDNQLSIDSNWPLYEEKLGLVGRSRLPSLQDNFREVNVGALIQYFSIYPTFTSGRRAEYTPLTNTFNLLFLLMFSLGIVAYLGLGLQKKDFNGFLLLLALPCIPYFMMRGALFRYAFFLQIFFTVIYGAAIYFMVHKINISKIVKLCLICILVISVISVSATETKDLLRYKYSFGHALMPIGGGRVELKKVSTEMKLPENENIFAPSCEISWYMNRPVVWDYRILFVPKEKVVHYFKYFNATYLLIPHYMLSENVGGRANTKKNWIGNTIPMDSGLYELLKEGKYFQKVKDYSAFAVYRFVNVTENG